MVIKATVLEDFIKEEIREKYDKPKQKVVRVIFSDRELLRVLENALGKRSDE